MDKQSPQLKIIYPLRFSSEAIGEIAPQGQEGKIKKTA